MLESRGLVEPSEDRAERRALRSLAIEITTDFFEPIVESVVLAGGTLSFARSMGKNENDMGLDVIAAAVATAASAAATTPI